MNDKGVLLTLGLAFYCAAFLALALVLINHTSSSRAVGSDMSAMGRISSGFISLEKAGRDVFRETSGIEISANATAVVFFETLPNLQAPEYNSAMAILENFSKTYLGIGGINVSMGASPMSFLIAPYGIEVTPAFNGNEFIVRPAQANFESYSIRLWVNESVNITNDTWANGAGVSINVTVFGDFNSSYSVDKSLSTLAPSFLSINNGSVLLNFTNGTLAIKSPVTGTLIEVGINLPDTKIGPAVYLNGTIAISLANPSISKSSRVRLL